MPQHTAFRSALPLRNNSFPCLCLAPLFFPCLCSAGLSYAIAWPSLRHLAVAVLCIAVPCRCTTVPCFALPCVAVPLRFTAVLCYAAAIPRSNLPRHGNSSLFNATAMSRFSSLCPPSPCIALPLQFSAFRTLLRLCLASSCIALPQHFIASQCRRNSIQPNAIAIHSISTPSPSITDHH